MKRNSLFIVSILLLVGLLSGCSLKSAVKQHVEKTRIAKTTTFYYQNLSKADKKKVNFKFSQDQDETKDNYADPVYAISLKITNHSNKIVKFDKSKFVVFVSESVKFPSTKDGVVTLKPGKSVSINQLIENVSEQALVGNDSYFIYLNNDNKLAKTLSVVPKAKAPDKEAESSNKQSDKQSDMNSSNNNSSESAPDDSQQQSEDTQQSISQKTEDEALNTLIAQRPGMEKLPLHTVRGDNSWTFLSIPDKYSWAVYDDGTVTGPPAPSYNENYTFDDD